MLGCAHGDPDGFTNVAEYVDWINEIIDSN